MKLVDEAVVIEYVELEKADSGLLLPDSVKATQGFVPGLKVGIIRDLQTSNIDGWKTNKLVEMHSIVLFNTSMPTAPSILPTRPNLDGKAKRIEVVYTQEIKAILEDGDIEKYKLTLVSEYAEAKRRVAEYEKEEK